MPSRHPLGQAMHANRPRRSDRHETMTMGTEVLRFLAIDAARFRMHASNIGSVTT